MHGEKLKFYIRVGNLSPANLSKISLKSIQWLRRYKWAKLAFQSIKHASIIKTSSTNVLHVIERVHKFVQRLVQILDSDTTGTQIY